MNKYICTLAIMIICPTALFCIHGAQRKYHKKRITLPLGEFHNQVSEKHTLLEKIRSSETVIATQPTVHTNLQELYKQLLKFPVNTPEENRRWKRYLDLHFQRANIIEQINKPEYQASSSTASSFNLHNLNILHTYWKKLRDTYPKQSEHYAFFDKKVGILKQAVQREQLELDVKDFEQFVAHLIKDSPNLGAPELSSVHSHASHLFGSNTEEILTSSPCMKELAKQITQKQWQTLAKQKVTKKTTLHRISPQEHDQLKIKISIAILSAQKSIDSWDRKTKLSALFKHLARCSSGTAKDEHLAGQFYEIQEQRASLEKELDTIVQSNCPKTLLMAHRTAIKLRNTYPAFHPDYTHYDQEATHLALNAAYHKKDSEQLARLSKNISDPLSIQHANRLQQRLKIEHELSKLINGKAPYKKIRQCSIALLSTYEKEDPFFNHYLNKIVRADLQKELEKINEPDLAMTLNYPRLFSLMQQMIDTYPENHPKRNEYINKHQTISCMKDINNYHSLVLENKEKPLNKIVAHGLLSTYKKISEKCSALKTLADNADITIHTFGLGNIEEKTTFYEQVVKHFDLKSELQNIENKDLKNHKKIKKVLQKLVSLPVLTPAEKNDYEQKLEFHSHSIKQHLSLSKLKKIEGKTPIDYKKCIELIEKVRKLTTLELDQILILENKLWQYTSELTD